MNSDKIKFSLQVTNSTQENIDENDESLVDENCENGLMLGKISKLIFIIPALFLFVIIIILVKRRNRPKRRRNSETDENFLSSS